MNIKITPSKTPPPLPDIDAFVLVSAADKKLLAAAVVAAAVAAGDGGRTVPVGLAAVGIQLVRDSHHLEKTKTERLSFIESLTEPNPVCPGIPVHAYNTLLDNQCSPQAKFKA